MAKMSGVRIDHVGEKQQGRNIEHATTVRSTQNRKYFFLKQQP